MKTKCLSCQVGTYSHDSSSDAPLMETLERDGMGDIFQPHIFDFCPWCGHPVEKKRLFKWSTARKAFVWKGTPSPSVVRRRQEARWRWMDRMERLRLKMEAKNRG